MSQSDVLNLLVELGGRATSRQIADLARKKFPRRTLHLYIGNRLTKLARWGLVRREVQVVKGSPGSAKTRSVAYWVVVK